MTTALRTAKKKKINKSSKQRTTLHLQHSFFGRSFAVVLHDFNMKLPSYTFYGGNVVCVPVSFLFSLPLVFTSCVCLSNHLHMDGKTDSKVQVVHETFDIGYHVGADRSTDRRTNGHVITKFSRIHRLPFSLTHGALLGALRA